MSIIKHVTLQKIVARDFRYDPRTYVHITKTRRFKCLKNSVLINHAVSYYDYILSLIDERVWRTGGIIMTRETRILFYFLFFCGTSTLFRVMASPCRASRSLTGHTTLGKTPVDE